MSASFPMRHKRSWVCLAAILLLVAVLFNPDDSSAKTLTKVKIGLPDGGRFDCQRVEAVIEQQVQVLKVTENGRSAKSLISESSEKFSPSRAKGR
jgi:hypothetical protein